MQKEAFSQRLGRAFLSSQVRLVVFFLLTWLGVAGLVIFLLLEDREQADRKAEADALAVSALLEARLSGTMQRLQADLEHLALTLPGEAFRQAAVPNFRTQVVRELGLHGSRFPEVASFRVLDASGVLLYATAGRLDQTNFSDRSYFRAFENGRGNGLFFSEVERESASARLVLNVAVPLRYESGGLKGVIVAQLDLAYLAQWFDSVAVGAHGVVSFRRVEDGSLILRRPFLPDLLNRPLINHPLQQRLEAGARSGVLRMRATLDGVDRIYGYRRLGDYPLYVIAGFATDDYLAEWPVCFFSWLSCWLCCVSCEPGRVRRRRRGVCRIARRVTGCWPRIVTT